MRKDQVIIGIVCFLLGFFVSPLTAAVRTWLTQSIAGLSDWLALFGTDWNRAIDLAIRGFYGTSVRIIVLAFTILPIVIVVVAVYLLVRWLKRRRRTAGAEEYQD